VFGKGKSGGYHRVFLSDEILEILLRLNIKQTPIGEVLF
jgi:hypothetical protein